ncbi:Aste57867_9128 [Aphanomyces stellatus]|uniref:Aste57867_9128 protein n=1 Tax=Aphanomyces stellatus TaxID=120398 RepID=A0A485KM08_9STRA|nr:hypothetical protein As57867_009092 [Aphanomyces stellatus]VFT86012.1 Aste57867_9128 [Aphanomyces stellatus]
MKLTTALLLAISALATVRAKDSNDIDIIDVTNGGDVDDTDDTIDPDTIDKNAVYNATEDPDLLPDDERLESHVEDIFVAEKDGCNGYVKYCNKRLSQVLWMGAHNSLTDVGFAVQRNQFVDGPHLLDAGVRYFDIDTCARKQSGKREAPYVCHGSKKIITQWYQPTQKGLQLIKHWMDANPREVIMLNFGDINDFMALDGDNTATSTAQLRGELVPVLRAVFGNMVVLRGDPMDAQVHADTATLQDLITANRRVIINIGKGRSSNPLYWGQNDVVCNDEWYPSALKPDILHLNYDWNSAVSYIDAHMRGPCAKQPQLINKLEFEFHTALGGTIDSNHVGAALASYMSGLQTSNNGKNAPYFPFNMVLTDHSDKWSSYYPQWHATHLNYLGN